MQIKDLIFKPCFKYRDKGYSWYYPIVWSMVSGQWQSFYDQVARSMACLDSYEISEKSVADFVEAFRYENDLIAADETEKYLAALSMKVDDLYAFAERQIALKTDESAPDDLCQSEGEFQHLSSISQQLYIDGTLGGLLPNIAHEFAGRLALGTCIVSENIVETTFNPEMLGGLAELLSKIDVQLSADELTSAVQLSAAAEDHFSLFCKQYVTSSRVAELIESKGPDWNILEIDFLWFDREDLAAECCNSLNADKHKINEFISKPDVLLRSFRGTFGDLLDELGQSVATQVFGIREGAISGPISSEGQFGVAKMQKKCPPTFQDPQILALAENTLIQEGLNRAIKKEISWLYEQA